MSLAAVFAESTIDEPADNSTVIIQSGEGHYFDPYGTTDQSDDMKCWVTLIDSNSVETPPSIVPVIEEAGVWYGAEDPEGVLHPGLQPGHVEWNVILMHGPTNTSEDYANGDFEEAV